MVFVFPVGLILMWLYAPWRVRTKWIWSGIFAALIALWIVGTVSGDDPKQTASSAVTSPEPPVSTSAAPPSTPSAALPEYRIVEVEDQSHKALDNPLSSYSFEELEALPVDKKFSYRVVVGADITQSQVRPLLQA